MFEDPSSGSLSNANLWVGEFGSVNVVYMNIYTSLITAPCTIYFGVCVCIYSCENIVIIVKIKQLSKLNSKLNIFLFTGEGQ